MSVTDQSSTLNLTKFTKLYGLMRTLICKASHPPLTAQKDQIAPLNVAGDHPAFWKICRDSRWMRLYIGHQRTPRRS
jgi:hypothetical protein